MDSSFASSICEETDPDVELIVNGSIHLQAFSSILKSRSSVFRRLLKPKVSKIEITEPLPLLNFKVFLDFLNGNYRNFPKMTLDEYSVLIRRAHFYKVEDLKDLLEKRISSMINFENCYSIDLLAIEVDSVKLRNEACKFMARAAFWLFHYKRHLGFSKSAMLLILESPDLNVIDDNQFMDAINGWNTWQRKVSALPVEYIALPVNKSRPRNCPSLYQFCDTFKIMPTCVQLPAGDKLPLGRSKYCLEFSLNKGVFLIGITIALVYRVEDWCDIVTNHVRLQFKEKISGFVVSAIKPKYLTEVCGIEDVYKMANVYFEFDQSLKLASSSIYSVKITGHSKKCAGIYLGTRDLGSLVIEDDYVKLLLHSETYQGVSTLHYLPL